MYKPQKKWLPANFDLNKQITIMQKFGLNEFLARMLAIRNIEIDQVENFLEPKIKNHLPDPNKMLDMQKAVNRILQAIEKKEKICVFGDYDVDGATSSALLCKYFADINVDVSFYIPDRLKEGYGPTAEAMKKIKDNNASLVITVDCGTLAFDAISAAKNIDLDVIVIDHHLSEENMPDAIAVINPNRIDENFGYNYLAAVGVSFLFLVALNSKLREKIDNIPNLLNYIDLVALGTVCDVMPIRDLNRAFVSQGLKLIKSRNNIGINALSNIVNLTEHPSCYHLGFVLGPRINAGGRVGECDLGVKLLSSTNMPDALYYAQRLNEFNLKRKIIETEMLDEAIEIASQNSDDSVLFVVGENWHPGVIGIIASRLKEKFLKPTAVVSLINGIGKASCRSINGIDFGATIVEAKIQGLLIAGGGHKMAAGFTVAAEKIEELKKFLNDKIIKKENAEQISYYDAEINIDSVNLDLLNEIKKLSPFGTDNPEPIFKIANIFAIQTKQISDKAISCILISSRDSYGKNSLRAVAFDLADPEIINLLISNKIPKISVIGYLKENHFQGKITAQFIIKEVFPS